MVQHTQDLAKAIADSKALAEHWLLKYSLSPPYLQPFVNDGSGYLKAAHYLLKGLIPLTQHPYVNDTKQQFVNEIKQIDFLRQCVNQFRYWAVDHVSYNLHYARNLQQAKNDAANCAEFVNCALELAYSLHDNNIFVISQVVAGED